MEKSSHNAQVLHKSSQLGASLLRRGSKHWLLCAKWASAGSQRGRPGRRDGLPGSCFESTLNSQTAEKLILLICNWLCVCLFCAVSVEADTEQKLLWWRVGLICGKIRLWSSSLRELQRRDNHKSLLMTLTSWGCGLALLPWPTVRQVSQPLPGSAAVCEEEICRKINPWNSLAWLVSPSLHFLAL